MKAEKTSKKQNEKVLIFCLVRFDRFDNPFDSIDVASEGRGGPPWHWISPTQHLLLQQLQVVMEMLNRQMPYEKLDFY